MTNELIISISEMDILKLKSRVNANVVYLHKSANRDISEEKKMSIYNMVHLLSDCTATIDNLVKLDEKRFSNNLKYIAKIQELQKEIEKLNTEIENLKSNIC